MSQVKIQGNASGTGIFTVASPNSNTDRTLTLPNAAGTMVIQDGSNNLLMNSGYGSDAVAYGCRAWVNFNGTGTVAIRGSGNVSSITDIGVGEFDINFTTAMPDANYAVTGNANSPGVTAGILMPGSGSVANNTASKVRVYTIATGGGGTDFTLNCVSIFR